MKKAFTLPIVIIIILLVAVPVSLFVAFSNQPETNEVKGLSTEKNPNLKGLTIQIKSQYGTWDLLEYACKTKEECNSSLDSGKRIQTFSGGVTTGHEIFLQDPDGLTDYKFVKFYVKPAWGSQQRTFTLVNNASTPLDIDDVHTALLDTRTLTDTHTVISFTD